MSAERAYLRRLPEDFPNLEFQVVREDDGYLVMEIVHPGGENPWISDDDDFVWGVGGAHCHHFEYDSLEEAYRQMCREIADYVAGRTMVCEAYRGEEWFQSGFWEVEDWMESCAPEILIRRLCGEEALQAGFRLEAFFWQAERDRVLLVQPDGTVAARRRLPSA